jgi:hypothetical protein
MPNAKPLSRRAADPTRQARTSRSQRGSAVITALVLAAVTAVIASGFLFRSAQEAKLATRSFFQSAALNLAEAGIEEGLHAANSAALTSANGWALVAGSTTDYFKTITSGLNFTQATGAIYIRVELSNALAPVIVAAGVISIPQQPRMVKQLRVVGMKRRLWANGIVARNTLIFSGSAQVDSYDSNLGLYNAATNRSDLASVATSSTAIDSVVVGSSASIYGYVATGGSEPVVGTGGRIYGVTTPIGTLVDQTRIRHDFVANLPDVTAPTATTTSLGAISHNITLPRTGDTPGANGRYVYNASSIDMESHDTVKITGPVDLTVTGNVSIRGLAGLVIGGTGSTNPSLNIYCPGSIELGGTSALNATNKPSTLTVWGTAPSTGTQTIAITGTADFYGTIYAPNATVGLTGSGATFGAVIGNTVTVAGNGVFHYDVRLGDIGTTLDVSYRITNWNELTVVAGSSSAFARDNRAPFASIF